MDSIKTEAHKLIDSLPDGVTWDQLAYRFDVRCSIERGLADAEAGRLLTQEEAEAAAIAAARKSAWREADGRWLCPLCYWRVCYWQAISTAKPAHSQQRADSSLRPGQKQRIITWNNPEQRPFS